MKFIIYVAGSQSYYVCISEGEGIFITNSSCKEIRLKDLIQMSFFFPLGQLCTG